MDVSATCVSLPPVGPGDRGAVLYWDGERWAAGPPSPGEGAVLTWGANGPFWANPALAQRPAGEPM